MKGFFFDELGHLTKVELVDPHQMPPNCTLTPPPEVPDGFVPVFYEEEGGWDVESIALAKMARADRKK